MKENGDFNDLGEVPSNAASPDNKPQAPAGRKRGDSSDNNAKGPGALLGAAQNSKQAKYQVPSAGAADGKASRQGSRTGSPQKKHSLVVSSQRETLETGLQASATPNLREGKDLGLKTKLREAL